MAFRACLWVQKLEVLCCSEGERGLDGVTRAPGGHTFPGWCLTLPWGGQEVTFQSSELGCRPPGHSLLGHCRGILSFIPVKIHLFGFRPVFPERDGIPLAPSGEQGLSQSPGHSHTFRGSPPQAIAPFHSFIQQAFVEHPLGTGIQVWFTV